MKARRKNYKASSSKPHASILAATIPTCGDNIEPLLLSCREFFLQDAINEQSGQMHEVQAVSVPEDILDSVISLVLFVFIIDFLKDILVNAKLIVYLFCPPLLELFSDLIYIIYAFMIFIKLFEIILTIETEKQVVVYQAIVFIIFAHVLQEREHLINLVSMWMLLN